MGNNKKTITVVAIAVIFALGVGIAIGSSIKNKDGQIANSFNDNNNSAPVTPGANGDNSVEELSAKLSDVMMPEEEFSKLESAIFQTAMGLFMGQAQQAGINVTDEAQQELKKSINEKYSRKYFSDMNADSMKELNKDELISIISFYNTEAGQKFLKLSPKIIQKTMSSVQADLSAWLPKTVEALVAKLKGGNAPDKKADPKQPELNDKVKTKEPGDSNS